MADYGRDLYCDTDMDGSMTEVSGRLLMQQVILRRLFTPRSSLLSAPTINTVDLRESLATTVAIGQREITAIKALARAAILDDARVETVEVVPRYDAEARTLLLSVSGNGAAGPFSLTLAVGSATVEVLNG